MPDALNPCFEAYAPEFIPAACDPNQGRIDAKVEDSHVSDIRTLNP